MSSPFELRHLEKNNVSWALEYLLNDYYGKRVPPYMFPSESVVREKFTIYLRQLLRSSKMKHEISRQNCRRIADAWLEKIISEKDMRLICPSWKGKLPLEKPLDKGFFSFYFNRCSMNLFETDCCNNY